MQPVDDAVERAVRSFAAAMIGEVAHELNNRLATMRETVGLLEDLVRAGKAGAAGTARAHTSLDDQVGRSLNIIRTLGGLGGALGTTARGFDAGAAIGDLLAMTERWAHRRSLAIERDIAVDLPRAAGDAALFLCLVHRLICQQAERLQPEGGIALRAVRDGSGIRVSLAPKGDRAGLRAATDANEEEIDRELARRLGGELLLEGGGALTLKLAALP
jgi:signal transduction histidine kinase